MSKSLKRKSKLKAADRRRHRRLASSPKIGHPAENGDTGENGAASAIDTRPEASAAVDVAAILTEAALRVAKRTPQVNDSAVLGALRAIKNGSRSKSVITHAVHTEMVALLDQASVSGSDRRRAASELLAVAVQNTDPKVPDRLIEYLAVIAS